jgi:hypothetical protein
MAILKRIGPAAALKAGLVLHALVGLIAGVLCSLIALTGAPFASHTPPSMMFNSAQTS